MCEVNMRAGRKTIILSVFLAAVLMTGCAADGSAGSAAGHAETEHAATEQHADGHADAAAGKSMIIGDTTFNSENWEETVDPHRTYNGWACIRYGIGETLVRYTDDMELVPLLAESW